MSSARPESRGMDPVSSCAVCFWAFALIMPGAICQPGLLIPAALARVGHPPLLHPLDCANSNLEPRLGAGPRKFLLHCLFQQPFHRDHSLIF